jgi:quercetin dioxygenase-like cupin family protein
VNRIRSRKTSVGRLPRWQAVTILIVGLGVAGCQPATPQEEVQPAVMFEDPGFRIIDVNVPPGAVTVEHTHSHDIATVSMSTGTDVRTEVGGRWGEPTAPRPLGHASVAEHAGQETTHRVENTGTVPYRLFGVENLRASGWSTAPPVTATDTTVAAESRAFRVYDVKLEDRRFQVSHTHQVPVIAILMAGKVISEGAEIKPETGTAPPSGLKQLDQPGQWVYIPPDVPHYVVRIGTEPVHVVEVEVR